MSTKIKRIATARALMSSCFFMNNKKVYQQNPNNLEATIRTLKQVISEVTAETFNGEFNLSVVTNNLVSVESSVWENFKMKMSMLKFSNFTNPCIIHSFHFQLSIKKKYIYIFF